MSFRAAIFSDVHANWPALRAVFLDIEQVGVDVKYCLGDIVGYGGFPGECIALVREKVNVVLQGNHDCAVAWLEKDVNVLNCFNGPAIFANMTHAKMLSAAEKEYLASLRTDIAFGALNLSLSHGNFSNPLSWKYIVSGSEAGSHPEIFVCADDEYQHFPTIVGAIGHTHKPLIYGARDGLMSFPCTQNPIELPLGQQKFIVNVGSVGQPRDHDPRACWTLWEIHKKRILLEFHRVAYDIGENADKMQEIGINEDLQQRLYHGR